jgi:RNA polymerase sigma factor (sigma-70 family)
MNGNNFTDGEQQRTQLTREERMTLFNKFIMPNLETIRSICMLYTNRQQDLDSNYNMILTDLYVSIHTYNPDKPLKTWLFTVVKNNICSNNKREQQSTSHYQDTEIFPVCEECVTYIDGLSFEDSISDDLLDAMIRTPPAWLKPFLMRLRGYTNSEISSMLKITPTITKTRISKTKKFLKDYLRQHNFKR